MAQLQQEVARLMMEDPDVETLSSFVGVDAANNTMLHTGRMLINLKSGHGNQQQRDRPAARARRSACPGIALYLQPTQDLTIDAESRAHAVPLVARRRGQRHGGANGPAKLVQKLRTVGKVRNVVTDADASGAAVYVDIDRDTAARLNISAAAIDEALYSAFGQRIVSTIFTETNQYRVILEAQARCGRHARVAGHGAAAHVVGRRRRRCRRWPASSSGARRCRSPTWRSTRRPPWASTPRRACRWARPWTPSATRRTRSSCRRA